PGTLDLGTRGHGTRDHGTREHDSPPAEPARFQPVEHVPATPFIGVGGELAASPEIEPAPPDTEDVVAANPPEYRARPPVDDSPRLLDTPKPRMVPEMVQRHAGSAHGNTGAASQTVGSERLGSQASEAHSQGV